MSKEQQRSTPDVEPAADEDVEGNSLVIGTTMASDLARIRSREVERAAREHARAKEVKQAGQAKPRS